MPPRLSPETLRLYAIFGPQDLGEGWSAAGLAEAVLRGGATCLQWRDKTALARAPLTERVRACAPGLDAARAASAPLLINDDVDLAAALQAEGVHLGQDDRDPESARSQLGPAAIIGWSVGTEAECERLLALQARAPDTLDYIGVGPAFATATKADAGQALGPEGVAALIGGLSLPAVAIGGIDRARAAELAQTGVAGVAVVSALSRASDPAAEATTILQVWKHAVTR
ncbi:MAG: thiamine phosphate synthase [Pseudomonadota bacterium]|nr:thiamine phosphate synthase [Pseudomonadota bacterium]